MSTGTIAPGLRARRSLDHPRIGEILRQSGAVSAEVLQIALDVQKTSRARVGDIMAAHELADAGDIAAAAAHQHGLEYVDLIDAPPDPDLAQMNDAPVYIRNLILPWRRVDDEITYVTAEPDCAAAALRALGVQGARVVIAEHKALRAAIITATGSPLAMRARRRRPALFSLRRGSAPWQRIAAVSIGLAALIGFVAAPVPTLVAATYLIAAILALNGMIWLMSVLLSRQSAQTAPAYAVVDRIADHRPPPRVTILIALYDEAETAPLLIDALNALDYPPELLDVKLVLEADDHVTGPALRACGVPAFAEILVTPDGGPRTKPRALNFAMEFARGDIIGVYDAEDRPAPDQLRRIAAQFDAAPADVACIQARLGYYNAHENFISRCFEIEYAAWFDVMLPGLRRLGLPIPLGGTSFFIRRGALVDAGGWDSFNVTEDADLGVMLARAGLKTELSDSLTAEEANSRPASWIKQRSRWLKGYLATWITHMSRPGELLADIGVWRFIGVNVLLLSAVFGYLALPAMWLAAWALLFLRPAGLPPVLIAAVELLGDVTILCIPALGAAACLGLWRRGRRRIAPFVLLLPLYWPLGAIAAYLAVYELVVSPSSWRKTPHGVGRIARQMRAETMRRDQS